MGGIRDAKHPNQASLWESKIQLGERFFHEIITNSLPINMNILKAMKRSPLGLDLYLWLTYRTFALKRPLRLSCSHRRRRASRRRNCVSWNSAQMNVPDRVAQFLKTNPTAFCDTCIANKLGLSPRQQAQHATSGLSATGDFTRARGTCLTCGQVRKVIRAN